MAGMPAPDKKFLLSFGDDTCIKVHFHLIECPDAAKEIEAGDEVEVNFDTGVITDKTKGTSYQGQAFPPFMQKIIDCEGLVNYINLKTSLNRNA